MRAPVNIVTPTIEKRPTSKGMASSFLTSCYEKLPFALKSADAQKQIEDRQKKITGRLSRADDAEPIANKRKIS
jgi:hypothetical protein